MDSIKALLITDAIAVVIFVIFLIAEHIKRIIFMKKFNKICPNCGNRMILVKKKYFLCEECGTRIKDNKINHKDTGED